MKIIKKLFFFLNKNQRQDLNFLILLILITGVIDMIGVASILPFMAVLSNPDLVETNFFLNYLFNLYSVFGIENNTQFLRALGFSVFILLIFSLLVKAISIYMQQLFVQMCEYNIGKRLFDGYLNQPYSWFLNRHSTDLSKSILSEVSLVITSAIQPIINIIAQGALSIFLLILLIFVNPKLTILVFLILGIAYLIIYMSFRGLLARIGKERFALNRKRFNSLSDAFGSIKEVKIRNIENKYISSFAKIAKKLARHLTSVVVVGQIPRFALEAIAFGGMILIILFLIGQNKNFNDTLPLLTLYTLAGYRLLPAIQNIYSSFTQLRFAKPAINELYDDLKLVKLNSIPENQKIMNFNKNIQLSNIYYNYPGSSKKILNNISINIPKNKTIGVIGPTGSGKTTIIDIIIGLLEVKEGTLRVDDEIINSKNFKSWQKNIGYVSQFIYLIDETIEANIAFGEDYEDIDIKKVEQVSKIAQIHDFIINELPLKYKTKVGERGIKLSGGQIQRIGIARALYKKPKLLVLDEATSALDSLTEQMLMDKIYEYQLNTTIILIAHRVSTLKRCDELLLIENGKIKSKGTYNDLIDNNHNIKNLLSKTKNK